MYFSRKHFLEDLKNGTFPQKYYDINANICYRPQKQTQVQVLKYCISKLNFP